MIGLILNVFLAFFCFTFFIKLGTCIPQYTLWICLIWFQMSVIRIMGRVRNKQWTRNNFRRAMLKVRICIYIFIITYIMAQSYNPFVYNKRYIYHFLIISSINRAYFRVKCKSIDASYKLSTDTRSDLYQFNLYRSTRI